MGSEARLAVKIKATIREETRGQGPVRTACQSEIERFCPGEKNAGRCLRSHSPDQLSEACKGALANRGSR